MNICLLSKAVNSNPEYNNIKGENQMTLGATLYVKNSTDAVTFYCDAFGMNTGYNARNDDGTYLHAELEKNGQSVFAVSESDEGSITQAMLSSGKPTMSLGVNLKNNEELRHAYERLSERGHILRPLGELPWSPLSADVVDKYGVCWYIYVSQHKPD
jgi:PhnB protein